MRIVIIISVLLINVFFCRAGGKDSLMTSHGPRIKHKHESESPLIEKMSDEQLLRLIDHMFEASNIPEDLWDQVMVETAKRNLNKVNRIEIADATSEKSSGMLFVEKLQPDSILPLDAIDFHTASNYYSDWEEDISILFKDRFTTDTTYQLELENPNFGCFKMPTWGPISSPFGVRNNRYHKGVDIQQRKGDTITAAFDGMVRFAEKKGGFGNVVIIRHYNGLETVYAHLSKIKVSEGQVVGAGDLIGLAGSTGHSTGPHLHFEVRFMGLPLNPEYILSLESGSVLFNTVVLQKEKCGLLSAYAPDAEFHTVKKGETLLEIANHYGTTVVKLRELNELPQRQYIRLKQGQTLRVRIVDHTESALSNH